MKKKIARADIMTSPAEGAPSASARPEWLRQRLDWLMDQRFGLILHWGPYAQWDCIESWPLVPADAWARPDDLAPWNDRGRDLARFSRDYFALNRTFNPARFDPGAWAALAAEAGARYAAFTTKHHDGFCLFDTATTDYKSTHPDCPFHAHPQADAVRAVFDAFRKKGLGISCYFSKSDWHSPFYWSPDSPPVDRNPNYDTAKNPERWEQFVLFVHRQIDELMSHYGPIDTLWLDGGQVRPPLQDIRMAEIAARARAKQPGLIIADRTVGGDYEDIVTPEQEIPEKPLDTPWESCITLGRHWKYVSTDVYKPAAEVIRMLVETSAKGGNLLLGVGPDPLGEIPAEARARLREVGAWLKVNGEGIFGARPVPPYAAGPVRYTRNGKSVYAFLLDAGGERVSIPGFQPSAGTAVVQLGTGRTIPWKKEADGFSVSRPPASAGELVPVLRFAPA